MCAGRGHFITEAMVSEEENTELDSVLEIITNMFLIAESHNDTQCYMGGTLQK